MTEMTARSAQEAVAFLKEKLPETPRAAFVLGSGVKVLENLDDEQMFSYTDVFGISPSVVGHAGSLSVGRVDGTLVAILRGRFHLYEGHDWETVTLPARVVAEWGVPYFFLTNAAGGINTSYRVGDLMLLSGFRDHLNPKWKESGLLPAVARPATEINNDLSEHIWRTGQKLAAEDPGFRPLQKGVYAALLGPSYETMAEIDMLKCLGADAVGMSTAPELLTVSDTSTTAAAISVVTNVWSDEEAIDGHEEVLRHAKEASERLDKLFRAAVPSLP